MEEVTKNEFLEEVPYHFEGDDEKGYIFFGVEFLDFKIAKITDGMASSIDDLKAIFESEDDDKITELNHTIMNHAFGNGEEFQSAYQESKNSENYNWHLEVGKVTFQPGGQSIKYVDVRLCK